MDNNDVNSQATQPEVENVENVQEVEAAAPAEPVVEPAAEPVAEDAGVEEAAPVEVAPAEVAPAEAEPVVDLAAAREELKCKGTSLSDEEAELDSLMGDANLDEALKSAVVDVPELEVNAKIKVRVVSVDSENVFVELGGKTQGIVPVKQFKEVPEAGAELEVVVTRDRNDDGLFEATRPGTAVSHADWSMVEKGMQVEVLVTGSNSGGLECKVGNLRGFIPISQIAAQRIENLEEFVNQRFECIITEASPKRNNLVLSRRKVLDKERESQRDQLIRQLAPGQIYRGVVRKILDFGAFVDIGGIDGLLHVSQISWERVKHPSDVLHEGQEIDVQVEKVDLEKGKISFSYRELQDNPWKDVEQRFAVDSTVTGRVTKMMQFGAFVELAPRVEGLVHISAISHTHVKRVEDVLSVGQEVQAKVLSVDGKSRRISLSIKAMTEAPAREGKPAGRDSDAPREEYSPSGGRPKSNFRPDHLKGGCGGDGNPGRFG